jgi:peptide/nickel transport system ATP-binding protein
MSASSYQNSSKPVVEVRDLNVTFTAGAKPVRAVDGVSLQVAAGETLALIGESGSGKSVTLRSLLRLHPPRSSRISGQMQVAGLDVLGLNADALADYRGRVCSMIFQEPLLALDPVYSLGDQIIESIRRHEPTVSRAQAHARALELFERVRIPSPERRLAAFPHEMSGGMRQRAMIALALACHPQVLLADEPTTALDATVQIQILLLLRDLQRELGLSIIFVTHDMGAAVEMADRIAVMYAGRIVEMGPVRDVIRHPQHPYTAALLESRAGMERATDALNEGHDRVRLVAIGGAPPDLTNLPPGCAFAPRCVHAQDGCRVAAPEAVQVGPEHTARCVRLGAAHWRGAPGPAAPIAASTAQ